MTPTTTRNLNRSAIGIGSTGVLLWVGVTIAMLAWPAPSSPLSIDDIAAVMDRQRLLGWIAFAGFLLLHLSSSLTAITNPRMGRRRLFIGLVTLWIGLVGLTGLLPGSWGWYGAPTIIGSIIVTDIPGAIQWLRGRQASETVS